MSGISHDTVQRMAEKLFALRMRPIRFAQDIFKKPFDEAPYPVKDRYYKAAIALLKIACQKNHS